jgi:hypothetical protein
MNDELDNEIREATKALPEAAKRDHLKYLRALLATTQIQTEIDKEP